MVALASFLLGGATAPTGCTPAPQPSHTGAEVGAIAAVAGVVVGTVVLVEVHKDHHTIKGCITASQSGLQVHDDRDLKTYTLLGATSATKAGGIVQLHGSKEKERKGSTDDPSFVVEGVNRTYGPCSVNTKPAAGAATASDAPKGQ